MNLRQVKKLLRLGGERLMAYGLHRSRGSRTLRRGRRAILRRCPGFRDRSGLPMEERWRLIERDLARLEARR